MGVIASSMIECTSIAEAEKGGRRRSGNHTQAGDGDDSRVDASLVQLEAAGDDLEPVEEVDVDDMPLKRNSSNNTSMTKEKKEEYKKKLQHKLYLAKENPENNFDLTDCNLTSVPPGVFSLCKVLRKETLSLQDNQLKQIDDGGTMKDLHLLKILDIQNNCLEHLPKHLEPLVSLRILNLQHNHLRSLPDSIGQLKQLQSLYVNGNRLKSLPPSLCHLKRLHTLNITDNKITSLHKSLCELKSLTTLELDAQSFSNPPPDVCLKGTESIMRFLCKESGVEYTSPMTHESWLVSEETSPIPSPTSPVNTSLVDDYNKQLALQESVLEYENRKENRRKQASELERSILISQEECSQLNTAARALKSKLLENIVKDQDRFHGELSEIHRKKEGERQKLVASLYQVEKTASELITQLLAMNEKARRNEAILEALERDKNEMEKLIQVRQEDVQHLRKEEVLSKMKLMLAEHSSLEKLRKVYVQGRSRAALKALDSETFTNDLVSKRVEGKQNDKNALIQTLMDEEEIQKEAFRRLQLQKDAKCNRITSQIELIQTELAQLSLVEIGKRELKLEEQQNILREKRETLTKMLVQLMEERKKREKELSNRMSEMELRRLETIEDYWLVQYQRLLDRKPESLISKETELEEEVNNILAASGAEKYAPLFAKQGITLVKLWELSEDDLKQMGVHELVIRRTILKEAQLYIKAKSKSYELDQPEPSAPPLPLPDAPTPPEMPKDLPAPADVPATAPPLQDVVARIETECIVCFDKQSSVIFLYCGHICCCSACAAQVDVCPLCRANIEQRVQFSVDTGDIDFIATSPAPGPATT